MVDLGAVSFAHVALVVAGVIIVYLLIALAEAKRRAVAPDIRYIDTSGISENPPRVFIEVWQGKTLNFRFDKYEINIPMVTITEAINVISRIAHVFATIHEITELKIENTKKQIELNEEQKKNWYVMEKLLDLKLYFCYRVAIELLYKLTVKKSGENRRRYRAALIKWCESNFVWTLDALEQINDYWQTVKKKMLLLAKGQTLKQTDGYNSSWRDLTLDRHGNRLIIPRYG